MSPKQLEAEVKEKVRKAEAEKKKITKEAE